MAWIYHFFYFFVAFTSVHSECVSQVYENTFFKGGDVAVGFTPSADYCRIMCTYHPTCIFFSHLPGNWMWNVTQRFACLLKDSKSEMLPKVSVEGTISGHSWKQCSQITACSKDVFEGLDMQGTNYNATTANNYHHCQKKCTNEPHCQFFTYASASFHAAAFRNICFLKYSTSGMPNHIMPLSNVISGFSLKPCQLAETGCRMEIFQHEVFSGLSLANVLTPDAFVCRTICTYHPNCLFFTFYSSEWAGKYQRYSCVMMTTRSGVPDSAEARENAMSGYSLLNCRKATPACHSQIYSNLNFRGTNLRIEFVNGYKACQQLCTDNIRCQFFTYASHQTFCNQEGKCKCYLRMSASGSPSQIVSAHGQISGYSLRLCQVKGDSACMQKLKVLSRVVGGTNSTHGEWPWQISLHVKLSLQSHFCGGSIINKQWILTAAHCTEDLLLPQVWRVYSGIVKQSEIRENTTFFQVQEIIIHPNYKLTEEGYDIALMKLDRPMNFTDFQQPLCLPSHEERNIDYTNCWVTGWGYATERGQMQDVLQKVNVPLISNEECQSRYQRYQINNKMVCAGYKEGGKDACKGDSGGPLQCKHLENWYLVGITSWGEGCARPGQPGVYTKVAEFVDWIMEKTSQ